MTVTLSRLWRSSPSLIATAALMLPVLIVAVGGLWLDPRVVTGAPVWLKPAKFAASIAIYTVTLAWVFTYLPAWIRTRRIIGRLTAAAMVLEIALISLQAWRGTTSHFNVATLFDAVVFSTMGTAIVVQTLASVAVVVALWRQTFEDRALGWALRLGLTLTILGAATGGLMTRPTAAQLADARSGAPLTVVGAHTVGAPDGGPGLPGTGWSTEHGDLRVPHFIGLHALQAFALLVLVLPRAWSDRARVRMVVAVAASYAGLYVLLMMQALSGESLFSPSDSTIATIAVWLLLSAFAGWVARRPESSALRHAAAH